MFNTILKSLMGSPKSPPAPKASNRQDTPRPFRYLDELRQGLGKRAENYVATGEDGDTLDLVTSLCSNMGTINDSKAALATNNMPYGFGGHPARLARYVRLRRAMVWGLSGSTWLGKGDNHKKDIPQDLRFLFEFFTRHGRRGVSDTPTKMSDIIAATKLLGGTETDVVVYCLPSNGRRRSLSVEDTDDYLQRLDPALLIAALDRCDTRTRIMALTTLSDRAPMQSPEMLPYLVAQLSEGSSKLRQAARDLLAHQDPAAVEDMAIKALGARSAVTRSEMVTVLGTLATDNALAALQSHKTGEKSQAVLTTLDIYLAAPVTASDAPSDGYIDVQGQQVAFPAMDIPVDDGSAPLGAEFQAQLEAIEDRAFAQEQARHQNSLDYWEKQGRKHNKPQPPKKQLFAAFWMSTLNAPVDLSKGLRHAYFPHRIADAGNAAILGVIDQLPLRRVIDLALSQGRSLESVLGNRGGPFCTTLLDAIQDGRVSLSAVIALAGQANFPVAIQYNAPQNSLPLEAQYLERLIASNNRWYGDTAAILPGTWEIAARHLSVVIDALPPRNTVTRVTLRALDVIRDFPSLPQALVQPVLFAAIDPRASVHAPAQAILREIAGIDDQLIALIADKRQAVRANAARFLADRGTTSAVPAIVKRLKNEKSDVARADLISALSRLGGDTAPYLGKKALLAEAKAYAEKLPADKIDWLDLRAAPALVWADNAPADPVLLDGWLRLAIKLKSPLGSPLFGLYLAQMTPESATEMADWLLTAWIAHDSYRPASADLRAEAEAEAKVILANKTSWMVTVGMTEEQIVQNLLAGRTGHYPNSGSDSKGVLALTHHATPSRAGPMIAGYLKQHGKRVSQAKALIETLFAMGSPEAVQVLVATATRFKQRTPRELAGTLIADLAQQRGWSEDELADRSIPTGGFEDDGTLPLAVGEAEKLYVARLGDDLTVRLFNPDGKEVKSIPAGSDDATKEAKALLSAAKKSVKAAFTQQQTRLYEAMLTPRVWDRRSWQDDLLTHPIMRRLCERVIWRGLDDQGKMVATLRPTAEGDVWDATGDDVDLRAITQIDIAHTATLDAADCGQWRQHLKDFEVKPLLAQFSRPVQNLGDEYANANALTDRQGWMMTTFQLRGAAKKLGYLRGPAEDGGGFSIYRKEFHAAGLWADLNFSGSYAGGEEDVPTALMDVRFVRPNRGSYGSSVPLNKVPPLLLSEVWNDLHDIAKLGAYDLDWQSKSYY